MPITKHNLSVAERSLEQVRKLLDHMELPHMAFSSASWEMLALTAREVAEHAKTISDVLKTGEK